MEEETELVLESLTKVHSFIKTIAESTTIISITIEHRSKTIKNLRTKLNLRESKEPEKNYWLRETFTNKEPFTSTEKLGTHEVREVSLILPLGVLIDREELGKMSNKNCWIFNRYIEIFSVSNITAKENMLEYVVLNSSGLTKYSNNNTPLLIEVSDGIRGIISV